MMLVVTGVGFLIHLYSIGYMAHEEGYARYFAYLNLFCFAMLTLVMGANFFMMFIGWEGVGLCSYLLIGYWFTDPEKAAAGRCQMKMQAGPSVQGGRMPQKMRMEHGLGRAGDKQEGPLLRERVVHPFLQDAA